MTIAAARVTLFSMESRSVPAHIRCPICGRAVVRYSLQRGIWDAFLKLFGRVAFRCMSCQARFHASLEPPPSKDS
jgi:DNA-directed RNA polymerase subunit RPC12/RpoP